MLKQTLHFILFRCLSIPVTMKYVFKKALNVQSSGEYKMAVDEVTEVPKPSFTSPPSQFFTQTSAVTLLASMIASTDAPMPHTNSVVPVPLLSPSPTLPNFLTPSPTRPSFPFSLPERQETSRPSKGSATLREKEPTTLQRPSIKIKLKKVASSDKYIIETPKHVKKENVALSSSNMEQLTIKNEPSDMETMVPQYQLGTTSNEQFLPMPPSISEQPMDFSSDSVSFTHLGGLGTPLLSNTVSANQPDAPGVADVEGIFQTLPGGATGSPGGLDVENPYGFESGLGNVAFSTTTINTTV